ncbi:hypothetical protein [Micromonospora sp. NBC_01412]|uniref:hypothetical protein n=1 Tax=Micromonospora sp. NBC_01412 TaxID=2903590 RepID=UPI003243D999
MSSAQVCDEGAVELPAAGSSTFVVPQAVTVTAIAVSVAAVAARRVTKIMRVLLLN